MLKLWALIKFAPKLAFWLKAAKPVAKEVYNRYKAGQVGASDEQMKTRLLEMRIEKLEAALAGVEKTLKRLVAALYLVAGVALAALITAIVKLA